MPSSQIAENGRGALATSLILLALLAAVTLTTRPYIPIDETRYVSVAWEMWLRGDFLVPFKNGETYSHKPPFMFWMFQAGWAVFGVNEWWPRLVSPLFSAAGLVLTHALARRLWPAHPGLAGRVVLILVSSLLWVIFSTSAMFDVLLAFWVLVGMHGVLSAAAGRRRGFILIGLAIGFGVLTKGPVVLLNLLPVAVLAPWWNPGLRWGRWAGGLLLAVALGAAIALAWAIPAGMAGGEAYRNAIFWGQTADRMVDSFAHRRPFWWYLPLLPLILFPWFVWPGMWRAAAQHRRAGLDRGSRFCLAWMLPVFVAFSFVSGKQPHYLLPLLPAFALFAARVLADRPASRVGLPAGLAALLGLVLVLAGSGQIDALRDKVDALPPLWPGLALVAVAALAWFAGRRARAALPALALLGTGLFALLQLAAARSIEPLYDVKPMAEAIRQVQDSGRTVANLARYHAQYQFLGRLREPLVELKGAEIRPWLEAHPTDYAVVYLPNRGDMRDVVARHQQAYRGGEAVLVEAKTAISLLPQAK
ncbi:MAG: glycosyltransferase [Hydrogenophilales bacterium 16-64-46]|nr:MAG: glycosyltransferase [Hydrogenophilales bacterium 12-64-13]OYZ05451.1 MAG: glycosyltransferase [Hydrogenophilales bacterium 16-64-46]OZA40031.1 MAG: glycosyltransferase [Hydrogenophilales bacterium 17-64-34]HQT00896.1 glycosyltransferase family 39 protein [Thiobacillus sp.]